MIAATLATLMQATIPQHCLRDGDIVTGEFRYVVTRNHDREQRVPFIVTEQSFCFSPVIWPDGPDVHGRWIQIHWSDDMTHDPAPGVQATVVVETCNEPGTTWHIGDVICDTRLVSHETAVRN
jgi:hypothetical protein